MKKSISVLHVLVVLVMCLGVQSAVGQPLTVLPDNPLISPLGATLYEQHSVSNFTVFYNINPTNGWNGVMVRWDDWGGRDLTAITQFVFGVTGTPQKIKVEFEDVNNDKTALILGGVSNTMQHWHIPADLITDSDLSAIKVISCVVDGGLAGTGG